MYKVYGGRDSTYRHLVLLIKTDDYDLAMSTIKDNEYIWTSIYLMEEEED